MLYCRFPFLKTSNSLPFLRFRSCSRQRAGHPCAAELSPGLRAAPFLRRLHRRRTPPALVSAHRGPQPPHRGAGAWARRCQGVHPPCLPSLGAWSRRQRPPLGWSRWAGLLLGLRGCSWSTRRWRSAIFRKRNDGGLHKRW